MPGVSTLSIYVGSRFAQAILGMIVLCALQAVLAALLTMVSAAVYRALAPQKPEV